MHLREAVSRFSLTFSMSHKRIKLSSSDTEPASERECGGRASMKASEFFKTGAVCLAWHPGACHRAVELGEGRRGGPSGADVPAH